MEHSRVAVEFSQHDFILTKQKVLNLYRKDEEERVRFTLFMGLAKKWTV